MAAPAVTAKVLPTGYKLPDGFKTTIVAADFTGLALWEKTVKMPGIDGGAAIDTTTMLNINWRTFASRSLVSLTEANFKAGFDPACLPTIWAAINHQCAWTIHLPENASVSFYAFMQKFDADPFEEGKFPEATVTLTPTNWDPIHFVEAGPVFTPSSGTA